MRKSGKELASARKEKRNKNLMRKSGKELIAARKIAKEGRILKLRFINGKWKLKRISHEKLAKILGYAGKSGVQQLLGERRR